MKLFTPGPWSWRMTTKTTPLEDGVHLNNMRLGKENVRVLMADVVSIADARLIAAAPDLLEALQAVVAIADRQTDEFDSAKAAIAKATRGTP